ncbi:MAG: polysaccharide deacetylase family protein [Pyrinomonadaceae bacterium]|nr:polysaccharide deacetylase family protein [Pyrinomonadaceae bacterium]
MKPTASLSLDLDNKWCYMKTHGDAGWETFPSYLDIAVPRALDFFKTHDLNITFFIVGQDAALDINREAIAQIPSAGHEVANHSFRHEPFLHLYSREELTEELAKTEEAIEKTTGHMPKGFRGPGFSLSPTVLEVLAERGYEYDCSTFPTYIAPLARAYYLMKSPRMSAGEREKLKKLYGNFSDGFQSLKPYKWQVGERELIEIPVTTMPLFKTPIHATYVIYLSSFSNLAARAYWKTAVKMCKLTGTQPSLLLHPLDFLSGGDVPELKFFPGMNIPLEEKLEFVSGVIETLKKDFDIVNMRQHAESVANSGLRKLNVEPSAAFQN